MNHQPFQDAPKQPDDQDTRAQQQTFSHNTYRTSCNATIQKLATILLLQVVECIVNAPLSAYIAGSKTHMNEEVLSALVHRSEQCSVLPRPDTNTCYLDYFSVPY